MNTITSRGLCATIWVISTLIGYVDAEAPIVGESPPVTQQSRIRASLLSSEPKSVVASARQVLERSIQEVRQDVTKREALLQNKDMEKLCCIGVIFHDPVRFDSTDALALRDGEFAGWILNGDSILSDIAFSEMVQPRSFSILHTLWSLEQKKLEGINLKIALGVALSVDKRSEEECVARYQFYRDAHQAGQLYPLFDKLAAWEMGYS